MKLKIKNFGPLTKGGTIDLDKRFYVFVGKNGSGKTYLANLVYGMFGYKRRKLIQEFIFINKPFLGFFEKKSIEISKEQIEQLNKLNNDLLSEIFGNSNSSLINESEITSFNYNDIVNKELYYNFFYEKSKESFFFKKKTNSNVIFWDRKENKSAHDTSISTSTISVSAHEAKVNESIVNTLFDNAFVSWLFPTVLTNSKNIFLPASRTSLLSLWKYIASTERKEKDIIFDINSNGKLLTENELQDFQSLYTKPVKELINELEKFDAQSSNPKDHYPDLVEELEELMGGKIKVHEPKEGIGRKRFTFEMAENGEEVELFLASSAVNQLSILYIYLKYWAGEKGNFLIIDEPEINLHPENQIKLVNILMKFADRNDNRVLITTHSTLLTDIINNHVRIGYLQTKGEKQLEWLKNHQLDINENITYKDFGVYHFTGDAIEEYPVGEYGVAFKDFNKVIKEVEGVEDELKDQIYNSLRQEEN